MHTVTILLNSIEKVKVFINIINQFDGHFDLTSGRYVVDAKSIMGIFSLDLSKPLKLDIYDTASFSDIQEHLKDFLV